MDRDCEQRILDVISAVVQVPVAELTDETGPDTVEAWDSMALINLALALEAEFGVQLPPEEVTEMRSVAQIVALLAQHGVAD